MAHEATYGYADMAHLILRTQPLILMSALLYGKEQGVLD